MSSHTVLGLTLDETDNPVVLLGPAGRLAPEDVLIPVWVGEHEAALIAIALSGRRSTRPLTHDVVTTLIEELGGVIRRRELRLLDQDVFATTLTVTSRLDRIRLNCRPADGVALAVRTGVPIDVPTDVVRGCGVTVESLTAMSDLPPSVSAFRAFLDRVEPEDFAVRTDRD